VPALGEFELIRRYFTRPEVTGAALLGIGDDCALLRPPPGEAMAVSTDLLVEGRHFFADVDPQSLGHKALAVNLSDLAAMGARPMAFVLGLSLPAVDERWLQGFAAGLFALADRSGCELVGGDTVRGPLTVAITVMGSVPEADALRRDGARAGDDLWVSGALGAAAWVVARRQRPAAGAAPGGNVGAAAQARLDRPEPRLALGQALRGIATAAIDLSDGLLGDLGHVLERSSDAAGTALGATLHWPAVPVDPALAGLDDGARRRHALAGGDDYELLFAAPAARRDAVLAAGRACGLTLTAVGRVDVHPGVRVLDASGRSLDLDGSGFDHFR
jgi:thiamine-monophosphate kinase